MLQVGPEPSRLMLERAGGVPETLRRFVVAQRALVDLLQERDRVATGLALLAQRGVNAVHHVAHRLHAVADARRAARLLLGRALRLMRDLAHHHGAPRHDLVRVGLLDARRADLPDARAHALHQLADVRGGARLLAHRGHDLLRALAAVAGRSVDLLERRSSAGRELDALAHARRAVLDGLRRVRALLLDGADQRRDLLGAAEHPVREVLDLVRHDREGTPLIAGLRRDDRCVEGQQVRLVGDVVDHVHHLADVGDALRQPLDHVARAVRGGADRLHALDRAAYALAAGLGEIDHV